MCRSKLLLARTVVLMLVLLAGTSISIGMASAQSNKDALITIEGTVDVIGAEMIIVSGIVVNVDGESDTFSVGDQAVVTVAPAGKFSPSDLNEGDAVTLTGTLQGNESTLKTTDLTVAGGTDTPGNGDQDQDQDRTRDKEGCLDMDPTPIAETLAGDFGYSAETIMAWFCDGFGFGEIMLVLRIEEALVQYRISYVDKFG